MFAKIKKTGSQNQSPGNRGYWEDDCGTVKQQSSGQYAEKFVDAESRKKLLWATVYWEDGCGTVI